MLGEGFSGFPVLVAHGNDDDVVHCDCATHSRRVLRQAGVALESHTLDGAGHGLDDEQELELQAVAIEWMERVLVQGASGMASRGGSATQLHALA